MFQSVQTLLKVMVKNIDEHILDLLLFTYPATQSGHDITSAYPPNADENLPWRIKFKSRPPLWRVRKLGSDRVESDNLRTKMKQVQKLRHTPFLK